jgi:hypothetical protein
MQQRFFFSQISGDINALLRQLHSDSDWFQIFVCNAKIFARQWHSATGKKYAKSGTERVAA